MAMIIIGAQPAFAMQTQERAIIKAVAAGLPLARQTLKQVVNINSGTMNFDGVHQVGDVFAAELSALGFQTGWVEGGDFGRAGHLVAMRGTKGPKILLIGHLDTVFAKTDAFQTFEPLPRDRVKGPGITDMKGGDVIIIAAMRALHDAGVLDQAQIKIVMTGDEESSGRPLNRSKAALIDAAKWADIALGFEDGDGDIKTAVIARRGSVRWTLKVTGRAAHSSQIFTDDVGYGAILETARILNAFREGLADMQNLTFNPGRIVGGTKANMDRATYSGTAFGKSNVVSQTALVSGGIRAASGEQLAAAKARMQTIASNNLAHTSAALSFAEGYPPMAPTKANKELLSLYSAISKDLGYGEVLAVNPRKAGAADISFTAGYVDAALDGLGLMGTGGHTKEETADMTTLKRNIEKTALLIYRLSEGE
ncbi:MAG: peptidase M20 [Robiginitomaculum sp.]|nr:MAG: peptidase M20 [Robiginitomaculum sp.]